MKIGSEVSTELADAQKHQPLAHYLRKRLVRRKLRYAGFCAGAYVYGSIPLIHLMARRLQVNLKRSGSGNVGASNLWASGGKTLGVVGWIFDASKGLLPIVIARRGGCPETICEIVGACGVAGQCWPMFLNFNGGRGISPFVGATFGVNRRAWTLAMLPLVSGIGWAGYTRKTKGPFKAKRTRVVPFSGLVGALTFPLACAVLRKHESVAGPTLLSMIIIARRMTAPLPDDRTHGPEVSPASLVYRILYDRNTNR